MEAEEAAALLLCSRQEMERRMHAQASEADAALAAARQELQILHRSALTMLGTMSARGGRKT